ncbi:potassium:proton antiporter [Affinibrenneria salicis]|uniref:Potassium:proton antiporter n=2 Tax=Affinibrenneria salicis TaxID=2590031 RepID=A0A5J5FVS6_9GAMM|nr:potassium:proton antiporter [Affinibrenneria salicis]
MRCSNKRPTYLSAAYAATISCSPIPDNQPRQPPAHPVFFRPRRQTGFSLTETLIAALLFSLSLAGLLQYHQAVQQAFARSGQMHQAWRLAHQALEVWPAGVDTLLSAFQRQNGWRVSQTTQPVENNCVRVKVRVHTPARAQAELARWFCPLR